MPPPVASPRSSPLGVTLFLLGLAALALAAWTAAAGGFRLVIADLTISIRAASRPLVAGLAAWAVLLAARRARAGRDVETARVLLARAEPAAALAVCLATAFVGVSWGSTVAGGADASGYLSEAQLWRGGDLVVLEPSIPLDDPGAAWAFTPLGYRPGEKPGTLVPTYPPGLPIQFALGSFVGPWAVALVVPLLGAVAAWCAFLLARRFGRGAGVAAAVLLASSPVFLYQLVQPMSDVPVTGWWLLAACALSLGARRGALSAGAAAGIAVATRPNLAPLLAVALALAWSSGGRVGPSRGQRAAWFCAGAAPALLVLAWTNTTLYGAPWASGYGEAGALFSRANIGVNLRRYAAWMMDVHGWLAALALVGAGVALTSSPARSRNLALAALGAIVVVWSSYLAYSPFESWTYLRFLLPAIAALAVLAGVAWPGLARLVPPSAALVAGTLGLALVAGQGAALASARGAFTLATREARYDRVADWVRDHTPADALVLCVQHSGSIHHNAGRSVLRWDLASPERVSAALGAAATARARARPLVIVLDADEEPAFRARLSGHDPVGHLDWPPRAATAPPSVARVYLVEDAAEYHRGASIRTELLTGRR